MKLWEHHRIDITMNPAQPSSQSKVQSGKSRLSLNRSAEAASSDVSRSRHQNSSRKGLSFKAQTAVREAIRESNAQKFYRSSQGDNTWSQESSENVGNTTNPRHDRNAWHANHASSTVNSRHADTAQGQGLGGESASPWRRRSQESRDAQRGFTNRREFTTRREVADFSQIFECDVPVGKMVERPIVSLSDKGAMLDAGSLGELFLPHSQLPEGAEIGSLVKVFIYNEGSRFCATAKRPYLQLGMAGLLKVSDVRTGTVYLSLGIPKDLVVPISEQRIKRTPRIGSNLLVMVALDEHGRLYGTQNFNRFVRDVAYPREFKAQQPVKVVAVAQTPLGFRVIVDDKVYGLIYRTDQKGELIIGKRYDGFIKMVRQDGRLDVTLQPGGREGVELASQDILQALGRSDGFLSFNDKSDPQLIEDYLHMSKVKFKKASGFLYKERLIELLDDGIQLTEKGWELFKSKAGASVQTADTPEQALDLEQEAEE